MNNCESDKVKLWKLIRSSNDELVTLYTDIENSLSEYLALLESCCEGKNDLLQQIIQQLDVLIQNLIDCCEAIKDRLDDIIDIIVAPIPDIYNRWQIQYNEHICFTDDEDNYLEDWLVQFEDHTCDNVPEEDFPYTYRVQYTGHVCEIIIPPPPDEEEWVAIFHAHICETREALPQEIEYEAEFEDHLCVIREPLPSEIEWQVEFEDHVCWSLDEDDDYWPIAYSVEFDNKVCIQDWKCDLEGQLVAIIEDDVTISYGGIWVDYTCVLYEGQDKEGELNLDGDGYIDFNGGMFTSSTTTSEITTTTTEEDTLIEFTWDSFSCVIIPGDRCNQAVYDTLMSDLYLWYPLSDSVSNTIEEEIENNDGVSSNVTKEQAAPTQCLNSYYYNGTNAFSLASNIKQTGDARTIACWVKVDSAQDEFDIIMGVNHVSTPLKVTPFMMFTMNNATSYRLSLGTATFGGAGQFIVVNYGQWTRALIVLGRIDNGDGTWNYYRRMYANGLRVTGDPTEFIYEDATYDWFDSFVLGARRIPAGYDSFIECNISDVKLWDRELSDEEIVCDYNDGQCYGHETTTTTT